MKHLLALLCLALASIAPLAAQPNPKPFVVPELTDWQGTEGRFTPSGRLVVAQSSLRPLAQQFADDYRTLFGTPLSLVSGKARPGDIVIQQNDRDKALGAEGYSLQIGTTAVLSAPTTQGLFWGTRTLLQISEQSASRSLPCGTTRDVPAYGVRGFMLDVGRKFIPMDYLHQLVKVMAYYKMNTLHIHLNDNGFKQYFDNDWSKTQSAFRLESDYFPGLTAKDGSYSKREFVDFQLRAQEQFVDIIPEIDVPAHSLAFTHYRPELGSQRYGLDHLDLSNPAVIPFLDSLFTEYCGGKNPVFRGRYVHIGTDEYSNETPEVVEQFRALTDHLIRHVERHGKKAMAWGALSHADGKTPVKSDGVTLQIWHDEYAHPVKMKELGYKLISIPGRFIYIVPSAGYFHDYLDCQWLYNSWTPAHIRNVRLEEGDPALLGGMFAVWNDHVGNGTTVKDIHHRLMPAMHTISTKCWTATKTSLPYADFDRLRHTLSEAPGVDQLARTLGKTGRSERSYAHTPLRGNTALDWIGDEIGYDYTVSFDLHADEVNKGDILFQSPHATFYLAAPESGRLAFEREGYLNEFDYTVPRGRKVTLTIQGTNRETRLLVDGQFRQALYPLTVSGVAAATGTTAMTDDPYTAKKMHYQRTLVFPLRTTGNFKGRITRLSVANYITP